MTADPTHIELIATWLRNGSTAVALTGAGISTESGIPDFRSPGGVWSRNRTVYFDEFLASADARHEYWRQKSEMHREFADAKPNIGHTSLAKWERAGRLRGVITQNIDGLHQLGGSEQVLELHGTARQASCLDCHLRLDIEPLVESFQTNQQVPECPRCAGRLKHATISFGQSLDVEVLETATQWSVEADLVLAIGSSLVVSPAANLPAYAKQQGAKLVIVNRDPTPLDEIADIVIRESIRAVLSEVDSELNN